MALSPRTELAELRQDLYEREVLSKREFEEGQQAQNEARRNVEDTRRAMADADRMLGEARMVESLARLTPLARGAYEETPGLVRYNGPAAWSLTQDVAQTTLVLPRRRDLHRRAAEALEALYPARIHELAPVLAHHYSEAEA